MPNGVPTMLIDPKTDTPYRAGSGAGTGVAKRNGLVTSVATSSTPVLAAYASRSRFIIQNQDTTNPIFVNIGAAAVAGAGNLRVNPGATLELTGTSEAVNAIATGAAVAVTVWEF